MRGPLRRSLVVALASGLIASLGASPAGAKLTYRTETNPVGPNSQSPVTTASCGKRSHVLGGGAFVSSGLAFVNISSPDDSGLDPDDRKDDAWQVSIFNGTGIDASVTAFAICHSRMPKYKSEDASVVGELDAATRCPKGTRVTGAGVTTVNQGTQTFIRTMAPFEFDVYESRGMSAVVKGSGVETPVFLDAICSKHLKLEYVKEKLKVPANDAKQKFIKCPRKTQVVGGGGTQKGIGAGWGLATDLSIPSDGGDADLKPDDAWRISVRNLEGVKRTVPVMAVCAKA
jgi:hypothetical protein